MMRYATVWCQSPACKHVFDSEFSDTAYYIECPNCGQMALIPDDARPITGRCPKNKCGRPWDDHVKGKCP